MDSDSSSHSRSRRNEEGSCLLVSRSLAQCSETDGSSGDGEEALVSATQRTSASYLDPAALCKEFEVHRSSAEYYLDQYLDCLAQSCEEPDTPSALQGDLVAATPQPRPSTLMMRLKISRDTLIRDVFAMETLLDFAKNTRRPPKRKFVPATAIWTAACTVTALTTSANLAAGISTFGAAAGVVALTVPPVWQSYQDYSFDCARTNVQQLRLALENDIGQVGDASRDVLKPSQFKFLRWASDDA